MRLGGRVGGRTSGQSAVKSFSSRRQRQEAEAGGHASVRARSPFCLLSIVLSFCGLRNWPSALQSGLQQLAGLWPSFLTELLPQQISSAAFLIIYTRFLKN
jgi:hypothetical protein